MLLHLYNAYFTKHALSGKMILNSDQLKKSNEIEFKTAGHYRLVGLHLTQVLGLIDSICCQLASVVESDMHWHHQFHEHLQRQHQDDQQIVVDLLHSPSRNQMLSG